MSHKDDAQTLYNEHADKTGGFFGWWFKEINAAIARQASAVTLLPIAGRYWSCTQHEIGGIHCLKDRSSCMIERVIACDQYEPIYTRELFRALKDTAELSGCLYCGTPLSNGSTADLGHLSKVLCSKCKDVVLDSMQAAFMRLTKSFTQEQRQALLERKEINK